MAMIGYVLDAVETGSSRIAAASVAGRKEHDCDARHHRGMAEEEVDEEGRSDAEGLVAYGMSPEMREALRSSIAQALKTAGPDFGAALRETKAVFAEVDPLPLMGVIAMYYGTTKEGSNPEFARSDGVFWHHLELAQAFCFREDPGAHSGTSLPFEVIEPAVAALGRLGHAWMVLEARKVQRATPGPERELAEVLLRLRVNSMSVRGFGYRDRLVGLLEDLLTPLDQEFKASLGWRPGALPQWWLAIVDRIDRRLEQHRAAVRAAVEWPVDDRWLGRVQDHFGLLPVEDDAEFLAQVKRDEGLRRGFIYHSSDLVAHQIFQLDLDELVAAFPETVDEEIVRAILGAWSLRPGEYADIDPGRFFLENPVLEQPFVADTVDRWHLFCPWVLMHNPFGLLEGLLTEHQQLVDVYRHRRADFLEERVGNLLSRALSGAQIETGIIHTDPGDGREYENDVLAVLDSYAVVAEAKAGGIGPEARRGRGRHLRERITALVEEPSIQAGRLADQLVDATGALNFRRKGDGGSLEVAAGEIRRVLSVGVTLEPVAGLLPSLGDLAGAELTDRGAEALAHSISLADLELVVDVLGHPSEVLHYLGRRAEIERQEFLRGDEVDLLGLYLKTGLNLGEKEFTGEAMVDVTGMSDPIDVWHYRRESGLEAEAPQVERTDWWEAVLSLVEERRVARWTEIGVTLCNVGPPEQAELEAAMNQLRVEITSGKRPETGFLIFHNGPPQRRDVFVGVIAASANPKERAVQYENAVKGAIGEHPEMKRGVLIAWAPAPIHAPYVALVHFDREGSHPR